MDKENILSRIDHSILKPISTEKDVIRGCEAVKTYGFATICIFPKHIKIATTLLPKEKIATVIAFPLHTITFKSTMYEIEESISNGAGELDIVLNISTVKEGNWSKVEKELAEIRKITEGFIIKLILECCYLTDEEKKRAGKIAVEANWDYLKTSTGYGKYGATENDIKLLKKIADGKAKVKASGGIRTLKDTLKFVKLGADRIGTSSGEKVAREVLHSRQV